MATSSCSTQRSSYTIDFKVKVLQWYHDHGENKHATARYFKVDRKTIHEWVDSEAKLKSTQSVQRKKRRLYGGRSLSRELDQAVMTFLMDERAAG